MGPSWHMWLCILLAVLPSLLAGPIETCSQQLPCFQLTFAASPTTPTSVPCDAAAAPGCQWRVCLRLALGGAGCAKAATDTVRHTCVPNASSCTPTVWGPEAADVADGFMQCKTGPAGGQLTFSLGDGEGCADSSAEVTGGPLGWPAGAAARCAAAAGLTCGAGGGDCLWTITLPPCSGPSGSPPPGRRSSQRLKAAAVRSSPSPSPFGVCEDVPGWKDSVNFTCEDYAANFLCNPDGSYGDGWLLDLWGPFSAYADANGVDATEACCACGRPGCSDLPQWKDREGDTCELYQQYDYCTAHRGYGNGWSPDWGTFADYAAAGVDATEACCACGRDVPKLSTTCGVNLIYEFSYNQLCDSALSCEPDDDLCTAPNRTLQLYKLDACAPSAGAGYYVAVSYALAGSVTGKACLVLKYSAGMLVLTVPHRAGNSTNCSVYCDRWCRSCTHVDLSAPEALPAGVAVNASGNLTVTYSVDPSCPTTDRYVLRGQDPTYVGVPTFGGDDTCLPGTQLNGYVSASPDNRAHRCPSPSPGSDSDRTYCSPSPSSSPSAASPSPSTLPTPSLPASASPSPAGTPRPSPPAPPPTPDASSMSASPSLSPPTPIVQSSPGTSFGPSASPLPSPTPPNASPPAVPSASQLPSPSTSPSPSPSPSPAIWYPPEPSASQSPSPQRSQSPSAFASASLSTSPVTSGSASASPLASPSPSPAASASEFPSPSTRPSPSPSPSPSPVVVWYPPEPSASPSQSPWNSPSLSPAASASLSPSPLASAAPSTSPVASRSPSPAASTSEYPSPSASSSPSPSPVIIWYPSAPSASPIASPVASPSVSPAASASQSASPVASLSESPAASASQSTSSVASPSMSPAASASPFPSPSTSSSPSPSPVVIWYPSQPSSSPSASPVASPSESPAASASQSASPEASPSESPVVSASPYPSPSTSSSPSPSPVIIWYPSQPSSSPSVSPATSASQSASPVASPRVSPAASASQSASPVASPSESPAASASQSASPVASPSVSPAASASQSVSPVASPSVSPAASASQSASPLASSSVPPAASQLASPVVSPISESPSGDFSPSPPTSASFSPSALPPDAGVGDTVWLDLNSNGIQDYIEDLAAASSAKLTAKAGARTPEPGLPGATVELLDCNGTLLATMTTNASGHYLFTGLHPGWYRERFTAPPGTAYLVSPEYQGTDPTKDSDIDSAGLTRCFNLSGGIYRGIDAGFYPDPSAPPKSSSLPAASAVPPLVSIPVIASYSPPSPHDQPPPVCLAGGQCGALHSSLTQRYGKPLASTVQPGCSLESLQELLQGYDCVQADPGCSVVQCRQPLPRAVAAVLTRCLG